MPRAPVWRWRLLFLLGIATGLGCAPAADEATVRATRVEELRAAAQAAQASGDLPGAVRLLEQAVALDARSTDAWLDLGAARDAQGDWQGAVNAFETAITNAPQRYEPHLALAILLMHHGVSGRARSEFDDAVRCDPGNARIHWNYGVALVEVGKPELARPVLQEALRLDPGLGPAEAELARVEAGAGRIQAALAHFARAESLGVRTAVFRANWGLALLQAGHAAAAVTQLGLAVELDSTRATWWNHLGVAALQAGDPAVAERALKAAHQRAPADDDIRRNLAQLYVQSSRYADAAALLPPPLRRADLLALRGMALRGLGRLPEARDCVAAAAVLAPRDTGVLNNYGVLLAETGDVPGALEVWRRVLELEPANAIARDNLEARGAAPGARPEE